MYAIKYEKFYRNPYLKLNDLLHLGKVVGVENSPRDSVVSSCNVTSQFSTTFLTLFAHALELKHINNMYTTSIHYITSNIFSSIINV